MSHRGPKSTTILNPGHLKIISLWTGDTIAAARAVGYKNPRAVVNRLMKNPVFVGLLKRKQESMAEESGKIMGREITVSRAEVINRLWELAQLPPQDTNHSIYGQIKAAEILAHVFDIKIDRPADLDRQLEGKTSEEVDFFVEHGYFPHLEPPTDEPELRPAPVNVSGAL